MSAKMEEFRVFVSKHPLLRDEVRKNTFTWQNIFEEWSLFGEDDPLWKKYESLDIPKEETITQETNNNSTVKPYILACASTCLT